MALLERHLEGKYEILEKIKEGGMGAVYKVRHRFLDEIRVIKVIRSALQQSQELSDRFLREARMAIRLRHPSIAVLHDFAVADDGQAFIVMEHIAGLTLEDVLRTGGPPPLGLALEVASQALRAMGYLHRHGLVHRDIAPDNLMLTRGVEGEPLVKLIDLGIAKVLAGEGAATTTGIFLGKPRYASPEHFGTQEIDHRSDLYSFGVVLYELLTGQCPVAGNDPASYMAGHLFRPPLDFAASDPHGTLPAELRPILLRALAKTPGERFPSAADFARALAPLQERIPVQAGDLDAVLQPALGKTANGSAPAPAGSSQALLDRQFVAGITPSPAAHAGSHLHWDPRLVAPETTPAPPLPAGSPPPPPPPGAGTALDDTLPLTARRTMPAAPATLSPTAAPVAAPLAAALPAAPPQPPSPSSEAAPAQAAEAWEARPLQRSGPPRAARSAAGGPAARTGGRTAWAWATGALLLVTGMLAGGAWWHRHSQTAAAPARAPSAAAAAAKAARAAAAQPAATPARTAAPAPAAPTRAAADETQAPADRRGVPQGTPGRTDGQAPAKPSSSAAGRRTPPAPAAAGAAARGPRPPDTSITAPARLGPGEEAAEPLEIPDAIYPEAARGTGKSPTVRLAVLVDERGNVADVRVKEGDSSNLGFNEAAVAAARKARFLAATRNGVPMPSWSELMIEFVSPPHH
ncbi:MAG TPA: TonB family protein [Thermoanaerobaculia bacterium]|nr:TonB family protein [Thermoanaerobaculia bacterium]